MKEEKNRDRNGNEKLSVDDLKWTIRILVAVDQFFRWASRIGTIKLYAPKNILPSEAPSWVLTTASGAFTVYPQTLEWSFFSQIGQEILPKAFNDIRELAGTPFDQIKWYELGRTARFLVRLLPCIFGRLETHPSYWSRGSSKQQERPQREPVELIIQDSNGHRKLNGSSTFKTPQIITNGDLGVPLLNGASLPGEVADAKKGDEEMNGLGIGIV